MFEYYKNDFSEIHGENSVSSWADPGILMGGAWFFFPKAWGLGAALRRPVGPEQRPGGGPGGEAPGSS